MRQMGPVFGMQIGPAGTTSWQSSQRKTASQHSTEESFSNISAENLYLPPNEGNVPEAETALGTSKPKLDCPRETYRCPQGTLMKSPSVLDSRENGSK